ncbi:hypothetical protein [Streptomyces spectabilis]|uniref:Uncharacterized protein n=1 Tax=Streptomyces spectabilis TaxID=68270 RepID=A0A5P2X6T2_STRST|nr:hypothetical protein [Streptomyces spectabilis]MBB5106000.1 hypothetical protein [Streptomyces spectabilis]MCI3901531.1 hypothetical protein [Streptomyces spectabilis]QEV58989.1 hypothetical protein CP982_09815 [Streptomyces spectabilis]
MATTHEQPNDVDPHTAVEELRVALAEAGIIFPSLAVDHASPELGLVNLGRVRAEVALRLARQFRREGRE